MNKKIGETDTCARCGQLFTRKSAVQKFCVKTECRRSREREEINKRRGRPMPGAEREP